MFHLAPLQVLILCHATLLQNRVNAVNMYNRLFCENIIFKSASKCRTNSARRRIVSSFR